MKILIPLTRIKDNTNENILINVDWIQLISQIERKEQKVTCIEIHKSNNYTLLVKQTPEEIDTLISEKIKSLSL